MTCSISSELMSSSKLLRRRGSGEDPDSLPDVDITPSQIPAVTREQLPPLTRLRKSTSAGKEWQNFHHGADS
eukprot:m.1340637 g.1340637  ORF g.1340637 m.1340637 type:complete len:72 (-) comp24890_c1_seq27:206-421(-)